jgi:hypothetical protein
MFSRGAASVVPTAIPAATVWANVLRVSIFR